MNTKYSFFFLFKKTSVLLFFLHMIKYQFFFKKNSFILSYQFFFVYQTSNDIIETSNNLDAVNRALYESVDIHCFFRFSDFVEFRMNGRIFWQENRAAVFKRLD